MKIDHATIVTTDIEGMRNFFCAVVGLSEGPRPTFGVDGCWLYASGQPLIHLIEGTVPASTGWTSPRIDHVALRIEGPEEWAALLARMQLGGIPYVQHEIASTDELQLFVGLAPGVAIEFVTRLSGVVDVIHESSLSTSGA